jgi:hypothetical protein
MLRNDRVAVYLGSPRMERAAAYALEKVDRAEIQAAYSDLRKATLSHPIGPVFLALGQLLNMAADQLREQFLDAMTPEQRAAEDGESGAVQ